MDDDDGRVVFYYSREKRLEKASPLVQRFNQTAAPRKTGLFRTLTATRPLMFTFISVITLCVAMVIISRFMASENTRVLENNTVLVTIIAGEGKSYITVKKTAKNAAAYSGAVDIAVSLKRDKGEDAPGEGAPEEGAPEEGVPIDARRIYFTPETEEVFRFSVPFTGKKMILLFEAGASRALFTITL